MKEFSEEDKSLLNSLEKSIIERLSSISIFQQASADNIPSDRWELFEFICKTFLEHDSKFVVSVLMPALVNNFIRVDTQAFVCNENHLLALYKMCKRIFNSEEGECMEYHAAKSLEVVILLCRDKIDQCILPFVELVLRRLTREVKTSKFRVMCLQVIIAALYYNPQLTFAILEKICMPNSTETITPHFIRLWIHNTGCFHSLHDRKTSILGLCTLISSPLFRTKVNSKIAYQILPSIAVLFYGLEQDYGWDKEDDGEEYYDLESDEDDSNENSDYLENLFSCLIKKKSSTASDKLNTDTDKVEAEEIVLEEYFTPLEGEDSSIDEYVIFEEVMTNLRATDRSWYNILTSHLKPEDRSYLQEVVILAKERREIRTLTRHFCTRSGRCYKIR